MKIETIEKSFNETVFIGVFLNPEGNLTTEYKIVFRSVSRNASGYEIFDTDGETSLSDRFYNYAAACSSRVVRDLQDDMAVLEIELPDTDDFYAAVKLALQKCESRYGNSLDEGDCIMTIHI